MPSIGKLSVINPNKNFTYHGITIMAAIVTASDLDDASSSFNI